MMRLIWSIEHSAWWGPKRRGYVEDCESAGRYSLAEADEIIIGCEPGNEVHIPEESARWYQCKAKHRDPEHLS